MAISKVLIALSLLSLLALHFAVSDAQVNSKSTTSTYHQKIDCGSACIARCQLSSRPNLCHRACGTCCKRCDCVPPGTSGNYDACPCYAALTTHGGRRKCP